MPVAKPFAPISPAVKLGLGTLTRTRPLVPYKGDDLQRGLPRNTSVQKFLLGKPNFPQSPIYDDFGRSNADPVSDPWDGPLYTGEDKMRLVSEQLRTSVANGYGNGYIKLRMGPDMEGYCQLVSPLASGDRVIFHLRSTVGVVYGYRVDFRNLAGDHRVSIDRMDRNVNTQLLSIDPPETFRNGDKFGASVVGDTIYAWYQPFGSNTWKLLGSATDSTYDDPGFLGLALNGANVIVDNFGGGPVNSSGWDEVFPFVDNTLDSFNRADETPITNNWSDLISGVIAGLKLQSNSLRCNGAVVAGSYYDVTQFGPDMEAFCTITTMPADSGSNPFLLYLRAQNVGTTSLDGYCIGFYKQAGASNDFLFIAREDDATETEIASINLGVNGWPEFADGDKIGGRIIGNTIEAWHCPVSTGVWAKRLTVTDETYTGPGYAALVFDGGVSTATVVEDFGANNVEGVRDPAFPSTGLLETFTVDMTTNWTQAIFGDSAFATPSNGQAVGSVAVPNWSSAAFVEIFDEDQEAWVQFTALGSSTTLGLRAQDLVGGTATKYRCQWDGDGGIYIYRQIDGSDTLLASGNYDIDLDSGFGARAIGDRIEVWTRTSPTSKWRRRLTVKDTTPIRGPGRITLGTYGTAGTYDYFGGGSIPSAIPNTRIPAFPAVSVVDDFTGTDETPIATNWTAPLLSGDLSVRRLSNQYAPDASAGLGSSSSAYWDLGDLGPDVDVFCTIATMVGSVDTIQLWARGQGFGGGSISGYSAGVTQNNIVLYYYDASLPTPLQSYTVSLTNGDKVGMRCLGRSIEVWIYRASVATSWQRVIAVRHTGILEAGSVGMMVGGSASRLDDFGAGNINMFRDHKIVVRARSNDQKQGRVRVKLAEKGVGLPPPIIDDFERGIIGPNWTTPSFGWSPQPLIVSGTGAARSASGLSWGYWNPVTFGPDCEVGCTILVPPGGGQQVYLYARTDPSGSTPNGYFLRYDGSGGLYIGRSYAGVEDYVTSAYAFTCAAGDKLKFVVNGSNLQAYLNGVLRHNVYDTMFDGPGRVALYLGDSVSRIQDFQAGSYYLETNDLVSDFETFALRVPDAQVSQIQDYNDLELWVWGRSTLGEPTEFHVAQAYLQLPADPARGLFTEEAIFVPPPAGADAVYPYIGGGYWPTS